MRYSRVKFLDAMKALYGDKYSCKDTDHVSIRSKYKITCKEHGDFWVRGNLFLKGKECPNCSPKKEIFEVKKTFDYYKRITKECEIHGQFRITPKKIDEGEWCPTCARVEKNYQDKMKNVAQPEDHKLIPLTKGKFALVDNDVFYKINKYPWSYRNGYAVNHKLGGMHRYIMNYPKGMVVDHINTETLDNRRINLRVCTHLENLWNSNKFKAKSGLRGVYKRGNKYEAIITHRRKTYRLGSFDTKEEAGKAYDRKAIELRGEFARVNYLPLEKLTLEELKKKKVT